MERSYSLPKYSDGHLVAAHLAGDNAAWEALLERYERFVFRLILRAGLSGADADDVFQNVCLKLYLHLEDLRQVEKLSGWLGAIVRQEVIRQARQRNRGVGSTTPLDCASLPDVAAPEPLPEQTILAEERNRLMREALSEMQPRCRNLLALLYGPDPASYAEISESLGIPVGSIGPQRARCLERLKGRLEQIGF